MRGRRLLVQLTSSAYELTASPTLLVRSAFGLLYGCTAHAAARRTHKLHLRIRCPSMIGHARMCEGPSCAGIDSSSHTYQRARDNPSLHRIAASARGGDDEEPPVGPATPIPPAAPASLLGLPRTSAGASATTRSSPVSSNARSVGPPIESNRILRFFLSRGWLASRRGASSAVLFCRHIRAAAWIPALCPACDNVQFECDQYVPCCAVALQQRLRRLMDMNARSRGTEGRA